MPQRIPDIETPGDYGLEIVGESHYQAALERVAGPRSDDGVNHKCAATLFLEPDNPHDRNAVRVEIGRATVGYLARRDAPGLRFALAQHGLADGARVAVDAVILGGRTGENYGVWLAVDWDDLTPQPAAVAAPLAPPRRRRPWLRRWWVWALLLLMLFLCMLAFRTTPP